MPSEKNREWQERMRTLSDSVQFLFDNKEMSDVTFVFKCNESKEEKMYAHSWILSMMSPVFYSSFKQNFNVSTVIPVTDKSYSVFIEFLRFIYTSECNITEENVFDIMEIAKKYALRFLEDDCVKFITKTESFFTINSACKTLNKIMKIGNEMLKDKTMKFIVPRINSILLTDSFITINKVTLREILSIDDTGPINETKIFTAAMTWATEKCKTKNVIINGENKRHVLGNLVKLIRFATMTAEEFGYCILQEDGLLTPEEKLSILLSISTKQSNNCGFIIEKRTQFKYLNDIVSVWLNLYDEIQSCEISVVKDVQKVKTIFSINKTIYLTNIYIGVSKESQNVTIELIDKNKKILCEENFEIQKFDKYCSKMLTLKMPILLNQLCEYQLNINYEKPNYKYFCVDEKIVPLTKILNDVEFEFTEVSLLLFGLMFKPFAL